MPCPPQVAKLIEKFELHRDAYHAAGYKEAQLRQEFIDPLFAALGWDMDNAAGKAEAYKDVIHEDAIKLGGGHKAPDYCFRIGGTRKFFVEAKKPAVNIKEEIDPAFQLRRYAWSSKLPLSILTDFEELAVYDCRIKPAKDDKASAARVLLLKYTDLTERWDEIAGIFSKDAIEKGSFDKYAESNKRKRGTAEVDAVFLDEIEGWRLELAKNLALRNPKLDQRDLNFAVQRIIDRIIFLRIAEDRGIEDYARLQTLLNMQGVYRKLGEFFRSADDRYNSGLFHFEREKGRLEDPDELTLDLEIDDKVLKEIIRHLYYPDSPYEFSVLSADILGQVYEQFLGKVIKLTAGHRAVVEEKPEVRKAGGVYYTPTYIVDYIVQQTVGKLLEGKTPKQAAKLKVLDPACGSGSFLIGAYQHLLDWHRDWYLADGPEKHRKEINQDRSGQWRLSISERKRILLNNIYGVDIDLQAVEVTKLSLCLKVLENANRAALDQQLKMFHKDRALPDLGGNIKCGNSLIGPDFYDKEQMSFLDEEERYRINVFDWSGKDGFLDVMKSGGFDAVIGNPPYVRQESIKESKDYFRAHFAAFDSTADLYVYFVERALSLIQREGLHAFIVSSSFLRSGFGQSLRTHIQKKFSVLRLTDFGGLPVFTAAKDTYVCVPLLSAASQPEEIEVVRISELPKVKSRLEDCGTTYAVPSCQFSPEGWQLEDRTIRKLFSKLVENSTPLATIAPASIYRGILTGLNEAFELSPKQRREIVKKDKNGSRLIKRFLGGQDVRRYHIEQDERFLIGIPNGWTRTAIGGNAVGRGKLSERRAWEWLKCSYPSIAAHLEPFAERARDRQDKGEFWWELRPCDYYDKLDKPKIVYPDIAKNPRFHLDDGSAWIRNTAYFVASSDKALLAVLNSKLSWFCLGRISIPFGTRAGEYRFRMFTQYLEKLPICLPDLSQKKGQQMNNRIATLVDEVTSLHTKLAATKPGHAHTVIQRQIEATDRQIDQLVYQLYGLTDDEIAIVEGATK